MSIETANTFLKKKKSEWEEYVNTKPERDAQLAARRTETAAPTGGGYVPGTDLPARPQTMAELLAQGVSSRSTGRTSAETARVKGYPEVFGEKTQKIAAKKDAAETEKLNLTGPTATQIQEEYQSVIDGYGGDKSKVPQNLRDYYEKQLTVRQETERTAEKNAVTPKERWDRLFAARDDGDDVHVNFGQRLGAIGKAVSTSVAGGYAGSAAVFSDVMAPKTAGEHADVQTVNYERQRIENERQAYIEELEREGRPVSEDDPSLKWYDQQLAAMDEAIQNTTADAQKSVDRQAKVRQDLRDFSADMAEKNAQARETALEDASTVGGLLVKTSIAAGEMGADALVKAATGSGMAPMLVRVFGNTATEVAQKGGGLDQQLYEGTRAAAVEYITEKLFDANPVYDGGDGIVTNWIYYIADKFGGSEIVRRTLSSMPASMLQEGLEGILSDVLNPLIDRYARYKGVDYDLDTDMPEWDVMLEDGIVEALLGGVGKAGETVVNGVRGVTQTQQMPRITLEDFTNTESPIWNNVEYGDTATQSEITQSTHASMVEDGRIVHIPDSTTEQVSESYPDLRTLKKAERLPILREKISALKATVREFLNGLKGGYEFEVNGNILEAKLYDTGVGEVMEKLTQDKASMLLHSDEVFANAQYMYSTPDYDGNPNVYRWNYFYSPVQIGDEILGVRIAVRDMAEGTNLDPESQIYNWGIKKDAPLGGEGPGGKIRYLPRASSGASNNSIPTSGGNVNGGQAMSNAEMLAEILAREPKPQTTSGFTLTPNAQIMVDVATRNLDRQRAHAYADWVTGRNRAANSGQAVPWNGRGPAPTANTAAQSIESRGTPHMSNAEMLGEILAREPKPQGQTSGFTLTPNAQIMVDVATRNLDRQRAHEFADRVTGRGQDGRNNIHTGINDIQNVISRNARPMTNAEMLAEILAREPKPRTKNSSTELEKQQSDGIIRNITIDDFKEANAGGEILPDTLEEISQAVAKCDIGYDAVRVVRLDREQIGDPVFRTVIQQKGTFCHTTLEVNASKLGGKSTAEINAEIAGSARNGHLTAQNIEEVMIHEGIHAKLANERNFAQYESFGEEMEDYHIDGISKTAMQNGEECLCETAVLIARGEIEKIPPQALKLWEKFFGGGRT